MSHEIRRGSGHVGHCYGDAAAPQCDRYRRARERGDWAWKYPVYLLTAHTPAEESSLARDPSIMHASIVYHSRRKELTLSKEFNVFKSPLDETHHSLRRGLTVHN